jgi:hypothetical protein
MPARIVTVFHQRQYNHLAVLLHLEMPVNNMLKVASYQTALPTKQALDEALRLTNHGGSPWPLRKEIQAEPGTHRSTLVGDVVTIDQEAFQYMGRDWKKLREFKG